MILFPTTIHSLKQTALGSTPYIQPLATPKNKIGYATQFSEHYNASANEANFQLPNYDDSTWQNAKLLKDPDYTLAPSPLPLLVFENIKPVKVEQISENKIFIDFGAMYVGYFEMSARGNNRGDTIETRFAQELNKDGSIRYKIRANCTYQEYFILSGKRDVLNQYDFKSFRYAEIILPKNAKADLNSFKLIARHMPFELKAKNKYQCDKKSGRSLEFVCAFALLRSPRAVSGLYG